MFIISAWHGGASYHYPKYVDTSSDAHSRSPVYIRPSVSFYRVTQPKPSVHTAEEYTT